MEKIIVGTVVFIYQHAGCHGHCYGLDEVTDIRMSEEGEFEYQLKKDSGSWYNPNRLEKAELPPDGINPQFSVGDRVHCFGTYQSYHMTATVEYVTWFEGKPQYYVAPTNTPWYPYEDHSLKLFDDRVIAPEIDDDEFIIFWKCFGNFNHV